jgi:hypothetical protein
MPTMKTSYFSELGLNPNTGSGAFLPDAATLAGRIVGFSSEVSTVRVKKTRLFLERFPLGRNISIIRHCRA